MASKIHHLQLILFLVSLVEVVVLVQSRSSSIWSSKREKGYDNWLSWNLENYRKKSNLATELIGKSSGVGSAKDTVNALDEVLRKAEMNKVNISVSQDGTANFTTITEALNSIPPRNTRRVILTIRPGVYRYINNIRIYV